MLRCIQILSFKTIRRSPTAFTCFENYGQLRYKHELPEFTQDFKAFEPHLSGEIMKIHYSSHHASYVHNLNIIESKLEEAKKENNLSKIISLQEGLQLYGGAHTNHSMLWKNLSPRGGDPDETFNQALKKDFGSLENMKRALGNLALSIQGSGWAWLAYDKNRDRLTIASTKNQDPLKTMTGLEPLYGIDVWEHAYYLQYKNCRQDYIRAIWNISNWNVVGLTFNEIKLVPSKVHR